MHPGEARAVLLVGMRKDVLHVVHVMQQYEYLAGFYRLLLQLYDITKCCSPRSVRIVVGPPSLASITVTMTVTCGDHDCRPQRLHAYYTSCRPRGRSTQKRARAYSYKFMKPHGYSAITLRFSDGPYESNFLKLASTLTFYG